MGMIDKYLDYREKLNKHIDEVSHYQKKEYKIGLGTIICEQYDILENPRGCDKWHGWIATGKAYSIHVYRDDVLVDWNRITEMLPSNGNAKEEANLYFQKAREICLAMKEEDEIYFK